MDSEPKTLYSALPVLYVTGVLQKDKQVLGGFVAPTYRMKRRTNTNFICTFDLRTEDPVTKWVLRGVCLLCTID